MIKCIECGDLGFITVKIDGEEISKVCKCRRQWDEGFFLKKHVSDAGIQHQFLNYKIEDYLQVPFKKEIKLYNEVQTSILEGFIKNPEEFINNYQILWIWGEDPNAGHTTLANMLGISLIKAKYRIKFIKMQHLVNEFYNLDKRDSYVTGLMKFDVYIIDDAFVPGRVKISGEYTKTHLFNFIDDGLSCGKHFIMTSDRLVNDLSTDLGEIKIIMQRSLLELELRGSILGTSKNGTDIENRVASLRKKMRGNRG